MPLFSWKGIDQSGKNVKGTIQALSEYQLKELLLNRHIALLSFRPATSFTLKRYHQIQPEQLCSLLERLALLISNGVELAVALHVIENTTTDKALKTLVTTLTQGVEKGQSLHQAMKNHPTVFNNFVVNLVATGQHTGKLGCVLGNIAEHIRYRQAIRTQFKQAALAPSVTLIFAGILVIGMLTFVFPYFESLYQSLGAVIPSATKRILRLSHFVRSWQGISTFFGASLLVLFCWPFIPTKTLKNMLDRITPHLPFIAPLVISNNILAFVQTISLYLSSGLSLGMALEQAQHTVPNNQFKNDVAQLLSAINRGKSFSQALAEHSSPFIDEQLVTIVRVGESSGTLDHALHALQEHLKNDLTKRLNTFSVLIGPLLMVLLGGIIGGIMILLYIPVFNLGSLFHQ
ncbi:MAG: type II secretion system F family protein [Candidatus Babeliales bacterium]|jgi:type IV pilus assembly protein PilC